MSKDANIFRQSLCTNCTSTGMCISIWILYGYGYAAKDRLLIFSWANQQILERTLLLQWSQSKVKLQDCKDCKDCKHGSACATRHILPSVAKKASTTSTAKSTAAVAGQSHPLSSCWLSKSSGRSVFELESCHRLIELSTVSLSLQYTEIL